jgi:hypothetical protein
MARLKLTAENVLEERNHVGCRGVVSVSDGLLIRIHASANGN